MERLTCANCGHRVSRHDVICRSCGVSLLEDGAVVAVEIPTASEADEQTSQQQSERTGETTAAEAPQAAASGQRCPECGAAVPDPANLICLECMAALTPAPSTERWELRFEFGVVPLARGEQLILGRETPHRVAQQLSRYDNVSRRHASVGVDDSGALWVRDENSTNGTFVDDHRLDRDVTTRLRDGAELRLASNVRAVVRRGNASHE